MTKKEHYEHTGINKIILKSLVMERKIGEIFVDEDGVSLEVVAEYGCDGCYYDNNECFDAFKCGMCAPRFREDGNSVIFKKVES
jgi:hypothetical protein